MNEIISSILQAEEKADSIILEANQEAKKIILDADIKAEEIKEDAVNSFKFEKKDILINAEKEASSKYDEKINLGVVSTEQLKEDTKERLSSCADKIVKEIIGK